MRCWYFDFSLLYSIDETMMEAEFPEVSGSGSIQYPQFQTTFPLSRTSMYSMLSQVEQNFICLKRYKKRLYYLNARMMRIPNLDNPIKYNYCFKRDLRHLWLVSNRPVKDPGIRTSVFHAPLMTVELDVRRLNSRAILSFESRDKTLKMVGTGYDVFCIDRDEAVLLSSMSRIPLVVVLDKNPGDCPDSENLQYLCHGK